MQHSTVAADHIAGESLASMALTEMSGVQGEELVIDENEAAIEAEPARRMAPLPEAPAAPGPPLPTQQTHIMNQFHRC